MRTKGDTSETATASICEVGDEATLVITLQLGWKTLEGKSTEYMYFIYKPATFFVLIPG